MAKQNNAPLQTREASVTPATVDAEKRTAELVFSTGARVRRYSWFADEYYDEELSLEPGAVRLDRMNAGKCNLLDSHMAWDLDSILGVIEPNTARIASGEATCIARFADDEDAEKKFRRVKGGIIRSVSVGYKVHKYERTPPVNTGEVAIYRAVDWEPYEVSLVAMPADAGAGVRTEGDKARMFPCEIIDVETRATAHNPEVNMTTKAKDPAEQPAGQSDSRAAENAAASAPAASAAPANAATAEADAKREESIRKAERERIAEVETIARVSGLDAAFVKRHTDDGTPIDKVRASAFEEMAKRSAAPGEVRSYGQNAVAGEVAPMLGRVENAILHRCKPQEFKLEEGAREFRGLTLMELGRDLLERRGVRVRGLSRFELATAALGLDGMRSVGLQGGSDLANILANVMNKSLRRAYDTTARTFTGWAGQSSNPDFKQITRTLLSGAPSLLQVKAGAEYKRGAVTDGKEVYQLATYGRTVAFTREAMINDDLSALNRLPALMGNAAADLESDTVYAILTANANLADGVPLFHATHGNLTGVGTAVSVASLGVGRAAMRQQKGLEGRHINLRPAYGIFPSALEQIAYQFTSADFVPATSGSVNEFKQGGKTAIEPVIEPRLDAASTVSWYLSASPSQIDTVEYCYLEGNEGVLIESRVGFEVDGVEMKVRHDFAAKALDHRGLYKNNGA